MTLEEIQKIAEADCQINETNVLSKQLALPAKKQYWAAQLFSVRREILQLKRKKDTILVKTTDEFNRDSAVPISIKTAEARLKERNEAYAKILQDIEDKELIEGYLVEVVKIYHNATFDIKNIIAIQQMNNAL